MKPLTHPHILGTGAMEMKWESVLFLESTWARGSHSSSTRGESTVASCSTEVGDQLCLAPPGRLPGGGITSEILKDELEFASWIMSWEQWEQRNRKAKLAWPSGTLGAGHMVRGVSGAVSLGLESLVQKGDFVQQAMGTMQGFVRWRELSQLWEPRPGASLGQVSREEVLKVPEGWGWSRQPHARGWEHGWARWGKVVLEDSVPGV